MALPGIEAARHFEDVLSRSRGLTERGAGQAEGRDHVVVEGRAFDVRVEQSHRLPGLAGLGKVGRKQGQPFGIKGLQLNRAPSGHDGRSEIAAGALEIGELETRSGHVGALAQVLVGKPDGFIDPALHECGHHGAVAGVDLDEVLGVVGLTVNILLFHLRRSGNVAEGAEAFEGGRVFGPAIHPTITRALPRERGAEAVERLRLAGNEVFRFFRIRGQIVDFGKRQIDVFVAAIVHVRAAAPSPGSATTTVTRSRR
jgi:hypothetical protein